MTLQNITDEAKKRATLTEATSISKTSNKENNQVKKLKEKEITNILSISKKVIIEFYKYASEEDRSWMRKRTDELVAEKGSRKYFAAFRTEFAHKFFPELCKKKEVKKTKSILEEFAEIDNAS